MATFASRVLLAIALLGFATGTTSAADFQRAAEAFTSPIPEPHTPEARYACNIRLSGPIEVGDLQRLKAIISADHSAYTGTALCLNSPGGNFDEGVAIAKFLVANGVYTVLEKGASCFSACAVIFMAGSVHFEIGATIARFMHFQARLGFHAPYVSGLPDKDYDNAEIEASYRAAVAAVRKLMQFNSGVFQEGETKKAIDKDIMPPPLLTEILERGPRDLLEIKTVNQAVRYRIAVYGYRPIAGITETHLCNACRNGIYKSADEAEGECLPAERKGGVLLVPIVAYGSPTCAFKYATWYSGPKQWLVYDKVIMQGESATRDAYWPIRQLWLFSMKTELGRLNSVSLAEPRTNAKPLPDRSDTQPDLAVELSRSAWVIGPKEGCSVRAKRYDVSFDGTSITWRSGAGNIDVEQVTSRSTFQLTTRTTQSVRTRGTSEPHGKLWTYDRLSNNQVKVSPDGGKVFMLSRCNN